MPYYREPAENDGFDDFDDFDNAADTAPVINTPYNAFDDDFDAPPERPQYPIIYNNSPDEEHEDFDPGPAKPIKEGSPARVVFSLFSILLVVFGIGVTAHYSSGFMPKDILSWHIGGATIGDLFKINHAEDLIEHVPEDKKEPDEPVYTEDTMPDSVRYADFDIYEGNTYCSVNGYKGTDLEIVLPSTYNGKPCTRIEANAFTNSPVTSVEIPDSYTFIGQNAFSGCSITDLYLPDSITEIGWGMCSGNSALKSVRLPSGLETIAEWAFSSCSSLTVIDIPASVKTVGQWAFTDCVSVTDINIKSGTVTLDNCAFYGCTSITTIVVPETVTCIGEMCFRSCTSLLIAALPESVEKIGKNAFMNCTDVLTIFGEKDGKWKEYADDNKLYFDLIENLDLSEDSSPTDVSPSDIQ